MFDRENSTVNVQEISRMSHLLACFSFFCLFHWMGVQPVGGACRFRHGSALINPTTFTAYLPVLTICQCSSRGFIVLCEGVAHTGKVAITCRAHTDQKQPPTLVRTARCDSNLQTRPSWMTLPHKPSLPPSGGKESQSFPGWRLFLTQSL